LVADAAAELDDVRLEVTEPIGVERDPVETVPLDATEAVVFAAVVAAVVAADATPVAEEAAVEAQTTAEGRLVTPLALQRFWAN